MASDWEWSTLGDVAINSSRPFSFANHTTVVFVNTGDVQSGKFLHHNLSDPNTLPGQAKKALRLNDILLTEIRPGNGRYAYVDFDARDFVVSTKFMVIESKGRVMPRFLYHVLTSQTSLDEFQRIAESRSGTFPQITFDSISHFPVPIPPIEQQIQLTKFFDELQERIDLIQGTNHTLEAIAQALFKSWFVDFDPVRAKSEGREPEGVAPEIADLFPSEFENSDFGEIPKGWKAGVLGEVSHNVRSNARHGELTDETAYIGLEHMPRKSIALDKWEGASKVGSGKSRFSMGQILFGKLRPYFHKVGIAPIEGVCSTDILVIEPKSPGWRSFCICHFSSKILIEHATQLSNGAKMPRTNWLDLANYPIALPPPKLAQAFDDVISPMLGRITENVHQTKSLLELRNNLLPRLMSGKLNLNN